MPQILNLLVSEIFGPTLQGEGRSIGMPCMFLRLAGCNLACSWCDTRYAWDWKHYDVRKETDTLSVDQVYDRLKDSRVKNLVITGGEPMLQQYAVQHLTRRLHLEGWHTEMETAGTITPRTTELVKQFNVSPKLENSGNAPHRRLIPEALTTLAISGRAIFKFVVQDLADFAEIDELVQRFALYPVYIQPEGIDHELLKRRLQELAGASIERGYYLTPRLHVDIWGQRRGV
jgi:7-carboxy-7-deazaguanine synthase